MDGRALQSFSRLPAREGGAAEEGFFARLSGPWRKTLFFFSFFFSQRQKSFPCPSGLSIFSALHILSERDSRVIFSQISSCKFLKEEIFLATYIYIKRELIRVYILNFLLFSLSFKEDCLRKRKSGALSLFASVRVV